MKKTEIRTIESRVAGDSYYEIRHRSGLKILVYPKEGFRSTYAVFGTRYGSIDQTFLRSDETEPQTVPAGIAHYLEHKLFESEEGDAFARFAKTGASANAYTSFDSTCYLFSCTDQLKENLEILLDFVQSPYFTEQTVQKEQGIIGQEIRMYEDDPQWRVLFNLLGAMYRYHPVKEDIAGSVESIARITPEMLYRCYHTFYNLHNMVLAVAGRVDVDTVLEVCDRCCRENGEVSVRRIFREEPAGVQSHYVEQSLPVALPLFELGFKEDMKPSAQSDMKTEAAMEVLLELLTSDASPLFRRLLDEGLINESSFSGERFEGSGFASVLFSGESTDPRRTAAEILEEVEKLRRDGIAPEDFRRAKKAVYGRNISGLNSAEGIANGLVAMALSGREVFAYMDELSALTPEDVTQCLQRCMNKNQEVLSVIWPMGPSQA